MLASEHARLAQSATTQGRCTLTRAQRETLAKYLDDAYSSLVEARENLSREWVSRGVMALRECDEYLQGAIAALSKCK